MNVSERLILLAQQYETIEFINGDPSWFMHQVNGDENKEVIAFIASSLSYGSRKQFMPKIQYILESSKGNIYEWIRNEEFNRYIPADNKCFYRLYNNKAFNAFLNSTKLMLDEHNTIGNYLRNNSKTGPEAIKSLTNWYSCRESGNVIPKDTTSACKRLCMYLRWMVRDNSPVDLGIWSDFIDKSSLIIPMDTHVLQESISLGLINSKSTSMANAKKLTQNLSLIFPGDPLKGDFALFGYGVNK